MDVKIYTNKIEESAQTQINKLMAQPAFANCKVRIMPDVHAGAGCVIGFTANLGDKVIPNVVGVDIGCGMLTVELGDYCPDFEQLDAVIRDKVPSGLEVHKAIQEEFAEFDALACLPKLQRTDRLRKSIGSLGGGNHFIEVDRDEAGQHYLIIHSGSRNLGLQVANLYQNEAIDKLIGAPLRERSSALLAELKAAERFSEIEPALKALRKETPAIPEALCYLEGEARERYLHDMGICQRFAERNRECMARLICEGLGITPKAQFHTTHNYIDLQSNIVRKGAISAKAGEPLLIPISMAEGCILGVGKGNEDWNCSAPHGAGRLMSRMAAKRELNLYEFQAEMEGIYSTCISHETLDEAPMAYRRMGDILPYIQETVEVQKILQPLYNFKAS